MTVEAERFTWETIGEGYAKARRRPWQEVVDWTTRTIVPKPGLRVLDLACGNGRHIAALHDRYHVVAVDFSAPLLAAAAARVPGVETLGDATNLPFRDRVFGGALFIAALHNVRQRRNRIGALAELARVLEDEAPALITVWSRWQPAHVRSWVVEAPLRAMGDAEGEFGDAWVDWPVFGRRVPRYYHFYSRRELMEDLRAAGFAVESLQAVHIASRTAYPDNLFAAVRKRTM
ncbi:MAG: class I SAM-dependent methyltransferase [Thermoplasmatota archaeon]